MSLPSFKEEREQEGFRAIAASGNVCSVSDLAESVAGVVEGRLSAVPSSERTVDSLVGCTGVADHKQPELPRLGASYPGVVLGLLDLATAVVLLVFLVWALIVFVRSVRGSRARRAARSWPLAASLAGIALFVLFNLNGFGTDPVIGTPTRAQVTGTWVGNAGATLVLRPDGTFTARGLPSYAGQPDSPGMQLGRNPASGHGTWVIGPGDFNGPPESVIFTFVCAVHPSGCGNQVLTFDLQAENPGPSGGPALFYYLGDPDDWADQYAFTRQ